MKNQETTKNTNLLREFFTHRPEDANKYLTASQQNEMENDFEKENERLNSELTHMVDKHKEQDDQLELAMKELTKLKGIIAEKDAKLVELTKALSDIIMRAHEAGILK